MAINSFYKERFIERQRHIYNMYIYTEVGIFLTSGLSSVQFSMG